MNNRQRVKRIKKACRIVQNMSEKEFFALAPHVGSHIADNPKDMLDKVVEELFTTREKALLYVKYKYCLYMFMYASKRSRRMLVRSTNLGLKRLKIDVDRLFRQLKSLSIY